MARLSFEYIANEISHRSIQKVIRVMNSGLQFGFEIFRAAAHRIEK